MICGGKPAGIFLGVPTIHSMWASLTRRLLEAKASVPLNVPLVFDISHGSAPTVVSAGRNRLCKRFLESRCDWLVMIDSDTVPPESFLSTLVFEAHRLAKPFVACPYPLWSLDGKFQYALGFRPPDGAPEWCKAVWVGQIPEGWSEVEIAGTGCVAIHRHIIESLSFPIFEQWQYDAEGIELLSTEDALFCWRVYRELGYRVWTHSSLVCAHWHNVEMSRIMEVQMALVSALERAHGLSASTLDDLRKGKHYGSR